VQVEQKAVIKLKSKQAELCQTAQSTANQIKVLYEYSQSNQSTL